MPIFESFEKKVAANSVEIELGTPVFKGQKRVYVIPFSSAEKPKKSYHFWASKLVLLIRSSKNYHFYFLFFL